MTPEQIEKAWKSGRADAVYFFYGEEEFLRDELLRKAIELLQPDAALRSFNFDQFDGAEAKLRDILAAARAYPVMADIRLVICRNCEKLFTARSEQRKQEENEMIAGYLEDPNRSCVLILDTSKPGAKNTHPWKGLLANSTAAEFAPMRESGATQWIAERAERYAKRLDTRAAQMLVSLIGTDLRALANELEKLVTYVGDNDAITQTDVEACISISPTYNVFNLSKAVGVRNKALATEIVLGIMQADKRGMYGILSTLARYFEQLTVAREMAGKSGDQEIAKALDLYGGAAYYVKDYINAARAFSGKQLDDAMKAIVRAELQTRRARVDETLLVERLVSEIIPTH
ncbi:MAG: DNA polymerase III subunit delta [Bacteroidetes bacterium]|nr:DNA polymerase III subunit delta [Bacteroidota bacterium]